jgi:hypothetical protein
MNNFKDYLNFSSNLSDNLYRLQLIALTEAKKKKEKKEKKADKDYDGDGELETGSEEFLGSKDKAIKANMAKKNDKSKKPNKKAKKKKKELKEDTVVQAKNFVYGGFPRVLNEVEVRMARGNANPDEEPDGGAERPDPDEDPDGFYATDAFNDANDGPNSKNERIATLPDLHSQLADAVISHDQGIYEFGKEWAGTMAGQKSRDAITAIEDAIRAHPESQAKIATAQAARAAEGPGFFSKTGGMGEPSKIDTPAERGLNMGAKPLPLTDYDKAKSARRER